MPHTNLIDLVAQVEKKIRSRRLLRINQPVLVAVSGGMDSMVLLDVLVRLSSGQGWKLSVAHLNHKLRGRSSDADERSVRAASLKSKLPYYAEKADVRALARRKRISLEMAAREVRHQFLSRVAVENKIRTIALAHHGDDQLELFFLRLLRGAGSEGLSGMTPMSVSPADHRVQMVRPLLDFPKSALADYARKHAIRFREDHTNLSLDFQRNRIRQELLPLLKQKYQPGLAATISRVAEILTAESTFVGEVASGWLKFHQRKGKAPSKQRLRSAPHPSFDQLSVAVQRRCLVLQLIQHGTPPHFNLIEQLRLEPGRRINLGHVEENALGHWVKRDPRGMLQFGSSRSDRPLFRDGMAIVDLKKNEAVVFNAIKLRWTNTKLKAGTTPKRIKGQEIFDADKVTSPIILRHWRIGDRYQPIGMGSAVKLQDVFVNQKVPKAQRHEILIATTSAGEIFWVEDQRISERFKLSQSTKRCLQWHWYRF